MEWLAANIGFNGFGVLDNHWVWWFLLFFDGCQPLVERCDGFTPVFQYSLIQLGWRDFTGFSPRIQQFSSRFWRELLNSRRESSNSRRIFSNSRQRIRWELLTLQKITTKREKRNKSRCNREFSNSLLRRKLLFSSRRDLSNSLLRRE